MEAIRLGMTGLVYGPNTWEAEEIAAIWGQPGLQSESLSSSSSLPPKEAAEIKLMDISGIPLTCPVYRVQLGAVCKAPLG